MCINKTNSEKKKLSDDLMEEMAPSDHPSAEQFNMLLNLLPPNTMDQVSELDSLLVDEADILMAAVNYILTLTSQLQEKLRWNARSRSGNNNHFTGGR
eukprot:GFUD01107049.1.p1 GENE.GFUD01107049.1~~GFUD01107049.1.p1  ORF type:complete len:114 (+),score=39.77 GFUD01107049.1:50-343(+)